jgi:hypothetical protein
MASMTPPADSPRGKQRQAYIVLGDLLDLDLPVLQWHIHDYDWESSLQAFIITAAPDTDEAAQVEILARWAIALGGTPVLSPLSPGRMAWQLVVERQGVRIHLHVSVSEEYALAHPELPGMANLSPPRADMYVRRSGGPLVEATS